MSFGNSFSFGGGATQGGFGTPTTAAPAFGSTQTSSFGMAQPVAAPAFGANTGFGNASLSKF